MSKVWLCSDGEYSDYRIRAAYSNKEMADASAEKFGWGVEEYELDYPNPYALPAGKPYSLYVTWGTRKVQWGAHENNTPETPAELQWTIWDNWDGRASGAGYFPSYEAALKAAEDKYNEMQAAWLIEQSAKPKEIKRVDSVLVVEGWADRGEKVR